MEYEIIYILVPKLTEEEAKKKSAEINKSIADKVDKVVREDFWGKKKLAYQIKSYTHGYYVLVELTSDPTKMKEINADLNLRENVIRFLITRIDDKIKEARKIVAKKEEERKEEEAKKEVAKTKPPEEIKEEATKKEKEEDKIADELKGKKGKTQLDDLDKKIEEILDEEIA